MKIYSILVHPSRQSLNASQFNLANKHFLQKGYEVEILDLYEIHDELLESVRVLERNIVPIQDRKYESAYHYTYNNALQYSDFSAKEIEKLKNADILYVQTPIMVWTIPSILKLYIESAFITEGAFTTVTPWSDDFKLTKLLEGKKVFFSIVMGAGRAYCNCVMGSVENMIHPIKATCEFVGYEWLDPHITWGTTETADKRQDYLDSFQNHLDKLF